MPVVGTRHHARKDYPDIMQNAMNIRDAYIRFNKEQAATLRFYRSLDRISREVRQMTHDLHIRVARELVTTRPGRKALHAFTGHTLHGWEVACGTDGRLARLAKTIGWEKFQEIVQLARRMDVTPYRDWVPEWLDA